MMKIISRVIAVLLAVTALLIAVLPAGSANATTKVHEEYEYDFQIEGTTVVKYLGHDSRVTLPNWVVRVGKGAFANNDEIVKIVFPNSVKEIDSSAFENCKNLQVADIPSSVRTIGPNAFSGCSNLFLISLPERFRSLGYGAFANCTSLSTVGIDENNKNYICIDGVIYSRDGKELVQYLAGRPYTSYTIPDTVTKIDAYAFYGAANLQKVSIGAMVNRIPEYSFANCSSLNKVYIPYGLETISAYAFMDCASLKSINIPDSVGYIDRRAFYLTHGTILRLIDKNNNVFKEFNTNKIEDNSKKDTNADSNLILKAQIVTESVENEYFGAEINDDQLELTELPENNLLLDDLDALSEDGSAFEDSDANNTDSSESLDEASINNDIGNQTNDAVMVNNSSSGNKYNGSFSGNSNWVDEIDSIDYSDNKQAGELGSSVILGGNALVMIPSETKLVNFDIDASLEEDLYNDATNIYQDNDSEFVASNGVLALYQGKGGDVIIPSDINNVGARAFYDNNRLKSVSIPNGVDSIGDFAFARSSVSSVSIPEGTKKIGYGAFYYCANLNDISIPSSVETIELGAFDGTPWMYNWKNSASNEFLVAGDGILLSYNGNNERISIPDSVKQIGAGAFANNKTIKSVNIPGNVTIIGEDAFNNCTNLKEVTLNEGVVSINDRAFKNTAIGDLVIPDSVLSIGIGAFDTAGNKNKIGCVIIKGKDLPNVSYKDTACRLSSSDLRTKAFEGVDNIVVEEECDLNSGTLLNPKYYGFNGQVYTINSKSKLFELDLVKSTSLPDANGDVVIDPHVRMGDFDYIMSSVDEHAFDNYQDWYLWSSIKPSSIRVNGNSSDELNRLLSSKIADLPASPGDYSGILVILNGKIFGNNNLGFASILDNNEKLNLIINEDSSIKDEMINAYLSAFGSYPNNDSIFMNVELFDKSGTIPINKLSDKKLEVSIPLPNFLKNKSGVKIACLDDNGILTELPNEVSSNNGVSVLNFTTGRCGKYIIYTRSIFDGYSNSESLSATSDELLISDVIISEDTFSANDKVGLINSLDKKVGNKIEVRWIVVTILLLLSGLLMTISFKKKTK